MTRHLNFCKAWLLGLAGCIAQTTGVSAVWLAPLTLQASIVDETYLDRLAVVESNGRATAVGKAGELGAYQIRRAAWEDSVRRMFGRIPASYAYCRANCFDPEKSRRVARDHLLWIERTLAKKGYKPTKISLYMSYNMGINMAERYAHNHRHTTLTDERKSILQRAERIFSP
jgi:hypothetical protein